MLHSVKLSCEPQLPILNSKNNNPLLVAASFQCSVLQLLLLLISAFSFETGPLLAKSTFSAALVPVLSISDDQRHTNEHSPLKHHSFSSPGFVHRIWFASLCHLKHTTATTTNTPKTSALIICLEWQQHLLLQLQHPALEH